MRAGRRSLHQDPIDAGDGSGDLEGRRVSERFDGSGNVGAAPQPMPTQQDRDTRMTGFPMDWDAAVDDAKAAGVKFWGDDMTTTSAKDVQVTAPVYGDGLDTTADQNSDGYKEKG